MFGISYLISSLFDRCKINSLRFNIFLRENNVKTLRLLLYKTVERSFLEL